MNIIDLFEQQKKIIHIKYDDSSIYIKIFGDNTLLPELKKQFSELKCDVFNVAPNFLMVKDFYHLDTSNEIVNKVKLELEDEGFEVRLLTWKDWTY